MTLREAVNAVNTFGRVSQLSGRKSFVQSSSLVRAMLESLKMILAKPKVRKEPVTADMSGQLRQFSTAAALV